MRYPLVLTTGATLLAGALLFWKFLPHAAPPPVEVPGRSTPSVKGVVVLSPEKQRAAKILLGTARYSTLQPTRTIPGRLDYDQDRHVVLKSASEGVVKTLHVRPGETVSRGQVVAVLSSPEVGRARADVLARHADVDLAKRKWEWRQNILQGVAALIEMIQAGEPPEEIEGRLAQHSLGDYRETLMDAYTRVRLAKTLAENSRQAAARGAVPARLQQQRESELLAAEAHIAAALEQSRFDVRQAALAAKAEFTAAQRQLEVRLQHLNALLGPAAPHVTVETISHMDPATAAEVTLVAPIDGTVEERWLAESERVAAGDALYTIADTDSLWAVADVRERDWEAMTVRVGQDVSVSTPALPDRVFQGEVLMVGRRVSPVTGAAPLIARLRTRDDGLRPGMFIQMSVPFGPPREAIMVPESAVVVHEGKAFVFTSDTASTYRRVDVVTGVTEGTWVEITEGLRPGDPIVITGAFDLKSELLLAKDST